MNHGRQILSLCLSLAAGCAHGGSEPPTPTPATVASHAPTTSPIAQELGLRATATVDEMVALEKMCQSKTESWAIGCGSALDRTGVERGAYWNTYHFFMPALGKKAYITFGHIQGPDDYIRSVNGSDFRYWLEGDRFVLNGKPPQLPIHVRFAVLPVRYREQHGKWPTDPNVLSAAEKVPPDSDMQRYCKQVKLTSTKRGLVVSNKANGKTLFVIDDLSSMGNGVILDTYAVGDR
jgi:hypothetical protein